MIINSTVIGYSHLSNGKECQDYSLTWHDSSDCIHIAAVSDGHGGAEYVNSAIGARIACQTAVEVLREFAMSVKDISQQELAGCTQMIARSILAVWNEQICSCHGNEPVKTFGCTLIAYLQTRDFWIGLQIGDGKFATLDRSGVWSQPIPWDDRCILNFTTSMCDEAAIDNFRFATGAEPPLAVFLSSDGIDSTFEDGDLLYNFYSQILQTAITEGKQTLSRQLPEVLSHFSKIGSQDDMSLAAVINLRDCLTTQVDVVRKNC